MRAEVTPGTAAEVSFRVEAQLCPHFDGVLIHPVCATWEIVHHMEVAGRKLLAPFLEPDEEGIGAHISVNHHAPAAIGSTVRVEAVAKSWTHRRLTCTLQAHSGDRLIAEGEFVQVVLPKERLERLFARGNSPQ